MLAALLARFGAPHEDPMGEDEARVALAALMVRAARSDGDFADSERSQILAGLVERYALAHDAAEALLADAETAEAEAPDTVRFTRMVKQTVPHDERRSVMEAIWKVALADGRRDPAEDAYLRQLSRLLGLEDRDSAFARHRAERG